MTRHLFLAISLIGTGVLFNSAAEQTAFNVRIEPRIAWADVPTSLPGAVTSEGIRTNAWFPVSGR
jgi:hypothetical protein